MADNFWPIDINPMALGANEATLPGGAGWERANMLPIQKNRKTGQWAWAVPNSFAAMVDAAMAPGKASQGLYDLLVDPETGENYYGGMAEDASTLAGMLTLGAGAVPAEANAIRMGMMRGEYLNHGSPKNDLTVLRPSERGPLGPGVYTSPAEQISRAYAGDDGRIYTMPRDYDVFRGHGHRTDDEWFAFKEDKERLLAAAEPEKREDIEKLLDKTWVTDGYPLFRRLVNLYGSEKAAQALFKRAGFEGLSGLVDGPEVLLFDAVQLAQ